MPIVVLAPGGLRMGQNALMCTHAQKQLQFVLLCSAISAAVYHGNRCRLGHGYDYMESQCGDLKDYHWEEVAEVYKEFMNDSRY